MPLATTSLKIEPELKQRLQKFAESRHRSANWLIGEALREFVAREEAREQFDLAIRHSKQNDFYP